MSVLERFLFALEVAGITVACMIRKFDRSAVSVKWVA